jgi:Uma2 family endonuclease
MSASPMPGAAFVTPEEYLERERAAETKSEYFDGEIVAMPDGSRKHSAIASNIGISLGIQLQGKPCQVFNSDLKFAALYGRMYAYPDVAVECGENLFPDDLPDVLTHPLLIVEVLSSSNEAYDRGLKFDYYRRIESLTDYLLVAQEKPQVERYHKIDEDHWTLTIARGLEGSVEIPALGVVLRLSEVYGKITFPDSSLERK